MEQTAGMVARSPDGKANEAVVICTFTDLVQADLAQLELDGAGIESWMIGDGMLGANPLLGNAVGVQLLVASADVAAARAALNIRRAQRSPSGAAPCPACGSEETETYGPPWWAVVLVILSCGLLFLPLMCPRRSRCRACGCRWR